MNVSASAGLTDRFAAAMERLGPFPPRPRVAVAVSGGADSMALACLAKAWAAGREGEVLALTVDHGLRAGSSGEADVTLRRLASVGIAGRKLTLTGLDRGPALAERARDARYRLLLDACAEAGIPDLLLGHHRGDQAETVMMRALSGSASRGLAGMPAGSETRFARLLRPLLAIGPGELRAFLTARGLAWIEDPSNRDPLALRARLRSMRADPSGDGEGTLAVTDAASAAGARRAALDRQIARTLAERAAIRPEGYAILTPGPIEPHALARLLQTISGERFGPAIDSVARLARCLAPATLHGVRILPARRLGAGWLLARETRAMEGPVAVRPGVIWDGRFRLAGAPPVDPADGGGNDAGPARGAAVGLTLGALGAAAAGLRDRNGLPAAVMHGLPAVRLDGTVIAVPHIGMGDLRWRLLFDPRNCAAGAPFLSG